MTNKTLSHSETEALFKLLKNRFEKDGDRFQKLNWVDIQTRLDQNPAKAASLHHMETTGGEPHLLRYDNDADQYLFCDFSQESPAGRRSLCYDQKALHSRSKNKPEGDAESRALQMGIRLLDELEYKQLQAVAPVDTKTSSWLKTPENIRKLGGAIFGDYRYAQVFIYHNGAASYYAARGFRGIVGV